MTSRDRFQTSIRIDPRIWRRLRALAEDLALANGGRPSLGGAISHLVAEHDARQADQREASTCDR